MQLSKITILTGLASFTMAAPYSAPQAATNPLVARQECNGEGCVAVLDSVECIIDAGGSLIKTLLCVDEVVGGIQGVSF
jgi:hypothetical protein